jgi:hypothetical protein
VRGRPAPTSIGRAAGAFAAAGLIALTGCGSDGGDDQSGRDPFVASDPGRAATVWAVGDGADGSVRARRVAGVIAAGRPDRFLYLGDVYEQGTRDEFARNYAPIYGRFDRIAAPTPGDHEWGRRDEGYRSYWRDVTGRPVPDYYGFETGGWEVLSLNTEIDHAPGSPQVSWLRGQVREAGTCRLAFWHRPRYSASRHGDTESTQALWDVLEGHGVLVVSGNDHGMQRFRPRAGITQLVAGAGGRELYDIAESRRDLVFADDRELGALRLELRPGRARLAFVGDDGSELHSGTVRCRPLSG